MSDTPTPSRRSWEESRWKIEGDLKRISDDIEHLEVKVDKHHDEFTKSDSEIRAKLAALDIRSGFMGGMGGAVAIFLELAYRALVSK